MSSASAWHRWARPPAPIMMMLLSDPWRKSLTDTTELPLRRRKKLIKMPPQLASLNTTESAVLKSGLVLIVAVLLLILSNSTGDERLWQASNRLWWERWVVCRWKDAWESELPGVVEFVGCKAEHCAVERIETSHY